ncbi:MAG: holo-ACP synthase AcpS [Microthrixaceae bacterium]
MGVLGLGIDLVEVGSFGEQLVRAGSTFGEGTFTADELAAALKAGECGTPAFARHLAARFAAKESFVKAWSMGRAGMEPAMTNIRWHEIEIHSDSWGRPRLRLSGETARLVADAFGAVEISVSMTHEDSMAAAVAVISAVGDDPLRATAVGERP